MVVGRRRARDATRGATRDGFRMQPVMVPRPVIIMPKTSPVARTVVDYTVVPGLACRSFLLFRHAAR
jgi:hypothetical protein